MVLTPRFTEALASQYVPVDAWALLLKVLQVVVVPVTVGVLLKQGVPQLARRMEPVMPPLAVVAIVLIVSSIVGSQRDVLLDQGIALVIACVLLHAGGFLLGWLDSPAGLGEAAPTCRTISIEVGMQNQDWPSRWPEQVQQPAHGACRVPFLPLSTASSAARWLDSVDARIRCRPVVEFEQQTGGEATGDASCHEQIADPVEQRLRIGAGCQALFEGLQLLIGVAAAPQGIDQCVFSRPRLGELVAGHRPGVRALPLSWHWRSALVTLASAEAGTKKAPVGSPELEAFSSLFFMILPDWSKDDRHI